MKHVKVKGIDEDLTAPRTPWIYYGVRGSLTEVLSFLVKLRDRDRAPMQVLGQHT